MANLEFGEVLEKVLDKKKIYSFEGMQGVRNINMLANILGYDSLDYLLEDNPFLQQALVTALMEQSNLPDEWTESMLDEIPELRDDE